MGSDKMGNFDYDSRQQSVDFQIDLINNQSSVLIISPNHDQFTKKLEDKECTVEIAQINTDKKNTRTFGFKNIENKKFQIILLDNTIDYVPNPVKFIKEINRFLAPDGSLICRAYNIFNLINRIRFLNGDAQFINSVFKNRNLVFSSLDSILLTLSEAESSITKLLRVEKEINLKSKLDLNTFTLTEELLNSVTTDSESKVFYYVFATSNALTVSLNTRKWSSSFSKYLVTEGFKGVLTDYKLGYEKHINYLKQTNREQYALMLSIHDYDQTIESKKLKASDSEDNKKFQKELETDVLEDGKKFLQRSLKEKDEYLGAAIKEEREYLETALKEKDKFLETALKGKDDYLGDALKEKDEYLEIAIKEEREYLDAALKEKDEYLDAALKEKDEYLENALRDKDKVIRDMQNSFAFRTMRKLDKLLGKKHKKK
jgi:SAM-dependent methyltransferase